MPSGLNSSTGNVHGAAIHATMTTTFICFKPGLITCYGPEYCGEILLCNLDIDPFSLVKPHLQILDQIYAKNYYPPLAALIVTKVCLVVLASLVDQKV